MLRGFGRPRRGGAENEADPGKVDAGGARAFEKRRREGKCEKEFPGFLFLLNAEVPGNAAAFLKNCFGRTPFRRFSKRLGR